METVLDCLKAMGKTTCRELAARMRIEPRETLEMLKEQEDLENVTFLNGYWSIPCDKTPTASAKTNIHQIAEPRKAKPKSPRNENELSKSILAALVGEGRMSTVALTTKTGRKTRSLNAILGALAKEGLVVRHVDKNNITWSLPEAAEPAVAPEPETVAAKDNNPITVAAVLKSITPFAAARPDDLLIPTVRGVNREIRQAKAKVAQLERLRNAVREIRKHKHLVQTLNGGLQ